MKIISAIFFSVLFLIFFPSEEVSTGFEKFPAGTSYKNEVFREDGFEVEWMENFDKTAVVDSSYAFEGKNSLMVTYPKGAVGPHEGGGQAKIKLEPRNEYYASYWFRFSEDFSWGGKQQGGKLPGLSGGRMCSGGMHCDGTNGFSARYMWNENGSAVLYLYHMDKGKKFGNAIQLRHHNGFKVMFPKGKWINLTERVKLNTVTDSIANNDGEVQVWYNGKEVLHKTDIRFVSNEDKIDSFYFSTFHGGNSPEWAPLDSCRIWFDKLVISPNREDVL